MFLFTTPGPAPRESEPGGMGGGVVDAIRRGADRTGISFDYLLSTARRESALDPSAKAPTSSATGLFQFIEQTWLSVVKQAGAQNGLGALSDAIGQKGGGALTVDDPTARQAILDLRKDPAVASVMAGVLTGQNRDALSASLGREPSAGELYAAHVLGSRGAADLVRAASRSPERSAAADFPEASAANRAIFYDRGGRSRSASEVYAALTAAAAPSASMPAVAVPAAPASPVQPGLGGLFQTGRTAPVSDAVARIWRVNQSSRSGSEGAVAFFPRSADTIETGGTLPEATGPVATASLAGPAADPPGLAPSASVPLPPPRPASVAIGGRRGGRS